MKNIKTKFEQFILENKASEAKYKLYDVDDNLIASFETFDKDIINKTIVEHLEKNPDGMVTYHINGDVNAVYEVNPKTDKPSLVITKGDKDIYKPLLIKESVEQDTISSVWDNGGESFDRYTIVLADGEALGMSDNPTHPQGFSQYVGQVEEGEHLGKKIEFEDLPKNVQTHVIDRIS